MSSRHLMLIVASAFASPLALDSRQYSIAPQPADSPLCGRVAAVSCDGPSSAVTLLFVVPDQGVRRITIRPEHRPLFGSRIEARYEQRSVCIRPASPETTVASEYLSVRDPSQLAVTGARQLSIALPGDISRTCDADVELPVPVREVHAPYTADAMRAKVHGSVVLQAIVYRNGAVGDVRVVESLEPSLDVAAAEALAQWQFRPGTRAGIPVAMAISVQMAFTLR
jgi:TonB family protein